MTRIVERLLYRPREHNLPLEILKTIFQAPQLAQSDLLQIMTVSKRWYSQAKFVLYQDIAVDNNFNIPLFLLFIDNYGSGHFVKTLSISHRSKNARMPPFTIPDHSSLLFLNCQNIVTIRMKFMNPFYMLRCLVKYVLPNLEKIDVCWETCKSSPSLRGLFYTANYNHKSSIKYIDMPGGSSNGVLHFIFEHITIDLLDVQFFEAFDKLEHFTFQR